MNVNEIIKALNDFGLLHRSFTPRELLRLSDLVGGCEAMQLVLLDDKRFVALGWDPSYESYFVLKSTLFRWFAYLTSRLARARLTRLNAHQLALSMSSLRLHGRWDVPPAEAIDFGLQVGFIDLSPTSGHYIFPLAKLLAHLSPVKIGIARSVLGSLAEEEARDSAFRKSTEYWVNKILDHFDERITNVIKRRQSLVNGTKSTLDEIGSEMGVTKERVRQIESEFWESRKLLVYPKVQIPLMKGLLCEIMRKKGSLVIEADSFSIRFIVKCLDIPCVEVPQTGLVILGTLSKDMVPLTKLLDRRSGPIDSDTIADHLKYESNICLLRSDLETICERIISYRQEHFTKAQRVYLALRSIGRPAHYSEVAAEYNFLFPNNLSNEHNVHCVLTREVHGVVWVGIRGKFALEEWGYQRPLVKLFDAVEEIVERVYTRTGKPVPFGVIVAEIGKYRQLVNPASLTIAAHCNPNLQRVLKNFFIPKEPNEQVEDEISADELDKILQEFQERN